jgi:hypothetical protein
MTEVDGLDSKLVWDIDYVEPLFHAFRQSLR